MGLLGSERDEHLSVEELEQSPRLIQARLADRDEQLEKMCGFYDETKTRLLAAEAELWRISAKTGEPPFPGKWAKTDPSINNLPKMGIEIPEMGKRPSWDEIWMGMAHELARRSIDPRTKVGCLIDRKSVV